MTREELARELQAIEAALAHRLTIVRTVIDMDGRVIQQIYRGTFQRPRDRESQER